MITVTQTKKGPVTTIPPRPPIVVVIIDVKEDGFKEVFPSLLNSRRRRGRLDEDDDDNDVAVGGDDVGIIPLLFRLLRFWTVFAIFFRRRRGE